MAEVGLQFLFSSYTTEGVRHTGVCDTPSNILGQDRVKTTGSPGWGVPSGFQSSVLSLPHSACESRSQSRRGISPLCFAGNEGASGP